MKKLTDYLPLYGQWTKQEENIKFTHQEAESSHGLALFSHDLEDGEIQANIRLAGDITRSGAMIVFRANSQEHYYAAGIGGWNNAYSVMEGNHLRFTQLAGAGNIANIEAGRTYQLKVVIEGQKVDLFVDSIRVISYASLSRQTGTSIGLFGFKETPEAVFSHVTVSSTHPKAFVAMQFSEPYNEVYRDAVEPLVKEIGFEPVRIDDVHGPSIIINDIINNLSESSIVIAEISEKNANVYYELGLAHAFGKPTLLLATKGTSLPFDVASHRCIFYENTIPGRTRLQASLKHSLMSLLGRNIQM